MKKHLKRLAGHVAGVLLQQMDLNQNITAAGKKLKKKATGKSQTKDAARYGKCAKRP